MSGVSFVVCESEMRTFAGRRFDVDWFALRLRLPLVLRGTCALLSIPRSRLERECRSPLEPFGVFAIFLSAMAMYAPQLVRMFCAFAGALPRPTLISRPFCQLTHCPRVHSVTVVHSVFRVSLMLNAKCKVHVMAS